MVLLSPALRSNQIVQGLIADLTAMDSLHRSWFHMSCTAHAIFSDICQKSSASPCIAQPSSQTFYGRKRNAVFTKSDFVLRNNVSSQFLQTLFLENLPILLMLLPFHYTGSPELWFHVELWLLCAVFKLCVLVKSTYLTQWKVNYSLE